MLFMLLLLVVMMMMMIEIGGGGLHDGSSVAFLLNWDPFLDPKMGICNYTCNLNKRFIS